MPTTFPRTLLLVCTLLATAALAQEQPATPLAAGVWQGQIDIPGQPLDVAVTLDQEADSWSGAIDIPGQGALGIPLEGIALEGDAVSFAIVGVPGEPTFTGTIDGDAMTGTFTQSAREFPFTLRRANHDGAASARTVDSEATEAAEAAEPSRNEAYEDAQGRFTFPIPTGWQVTEGDELVTAQDPSGGIRMHIVATETEDLDAAVREAWSRAVPEFDLEPDETLEPPSEPGVERTIVVNYDPDDDERVYQAFGQLHEGTAYVLLIDANLADLQRRAAQLGIIASGLTITAIDDVDLTGQQPRPVDVVVAELRAFTEAQMEAFGIPGAAIAIVQGDEVVHAEGFGTTQAGGNEPVTPQTHMMIGSTGKTMTSMLVGTLVDAGIVQWDTPVVEVLPEFEVADPELTQRITLRNLLCACTGVPRRDMELFFNADELSAEALVDQLSTFEFFTEFGEAFQYSNQLVATSGYAAAAADGAEYGDLFEGYARSLQERVLGPIGLDDTTLSFGEVRDRGMHAVPHQQNLESGAYEPIDLSVEEVLLPVAPAGSHWSTAEDMGRYLATLMNAGVTPEGERVVSEENLRVTWEPQVPISASESYGLGWFVGEYKGLDRLYHAGNTLGFTSEFAFLPEADVGIVVLANAQVANGFTGAVVARLFELLYDLESEAEANAAFFVEQTETSLAETRERLQDAVDPADVESFLGRYQNPALGLITLAMEGEQLVLDAGEFRTEVRPLLDAEGDFDSYITYGGPATGLPLELQKDDPGQPTVALGQGVVRYVFERVE